MFSVTLSTTKANSYGDGDLVDVLVSSLQVTLFTVVAGVDIERPAPKAAWRAGACPRPACDCQEKNIDQQTKHWDWMPPSCFAPEGHIPCRLPPPDDVKTEIHYQETVDYRQPLLTTPPPGLALHPPSPQRPWWRCSPVEWLSGPGHHDHQHCQQHQGTANELAVLRVWYSAIHVKCFVFELFAFQSAQIINLPLDSPPWNLVGSLQQIRWTHPRPNSGFHYS